MGEAKNRRMFLSGDNNEAARAALKAAEDAVAQPQVVFEIKVQILDNNKVNIVHPAMPPGHEALSAGALVDMLAEAIQLVVQTYLKGEKPSLIIQPPPGARL